MDHRFHGGDGPGCLGLFLIIGGLLVLFEFAGGAIGKAMGWLS